MNIHYIRFLSTILPVTFCILGAQWLSGRVLDSRPRGRRFEPYWRHCGVSLSKNINPSLVQVQRRKTHPYITERLLMGGKESNQTNKQTFCIFLKHWHSIESVSEDKFFNVFLHFAQVPFFINVANVFLRIH